MNKRTIQIIIFLACFSLAGIVITQLFWVQKSMSLQEKSFYNRAKQAMRTVAGQLLESNQDSTTRIEPIEISNPMFFVCKVNTPIDSFLLSSLLKYEFEYQDIEADYVYGIYDCFSDSITLTKCVIDNIETGNCVEVPEEHFHFEKGVANFWVYFPRPEGFLISQIGKWLFSSIGLLVIVIFTFSFTIFSIIKQKKLSEMKTDFINNMTHELKTPISTIGLSTEVLMKDETQADKEKIQRYARIISEENNRLRTQVEKVLQMAILDRGQFELNVKELDIHDLLDSAVEKQRITVENRGGTLDLEKNAEQSIIHGDWEHLQSVVENLLDNANKYSLENPTIEVETSNNKHGILIHVTDHGIGMDKESQKHIFDKFYRVSTGDVHDVKGFGLGLNYVKIIVDAHEGDIKVISSLDKGSTFEIFLPFA